MNYGLLARQPNIKFKARPARDLLEMILALLLTYRMKSLDGALDISPYSIRATVNKLIFFAGSSSTTTTEAWTGVVVQIMVTHDPV